MSDIPRCPMASLARRPADAAKGTQKHGFTAGERVEVTNDLHFCGWHGIVINFSTQLVAVELNEPPVGHRPNGQWFRPEELRKAPKD